MELKDLPDAWRIPTQNHLVHTALIGSLMTLMTRTGIATPEEIADLIDQHAQASEHEAVRNDLAMWSSGLRSGKPILTVIDGGLSDPD